MCAKEQWQATVARNPRVSAVDVPAEHCGAVGAAGQAPRSRHAAGTPQRAVHATVTKHSVTCAGA